MYFFNEDQILFIRCLNKDISNPDCYKCFQVNDFWNIVKRFDEDEEFISYFIKLGLKDNINLSSSIIYQFPSFDFKKFNVYEFPKIEETIYQKQSLTEYEIPQYIGDIPEGFSIFCTLWEASKVKQYVKLSQEEQDLLGTGENEEKSKDDDDILQEPIPKTNFCHVCRRKFDDYLKHINSLIHKNNIDRNFIAFSTAIYTFRRINYFWNNKSDSQSLEVSKYLDVSISSFSFSFLKSKSDDSNVIDKDNSFILVSEKTKNKNNNKENENENIKTKKDKRNALTKNKSLIISPSNREKLLDNKFNNTQLTSSQSSLNLFINKKRKGNNIFEKEKEKKNISCEKKVEKIEKVEKEYFIELNVVDNKKLIRGVDVFFK